MVFGNFCKFVINTIRLIIAAGLDLTFLFFLKSIKPDSSQEELKIRSLTPTTAGRTVENERVA